MNTKLAAVILGLSVFLVAAKGGVADRIHGSDGAAFRNWRPARDLNNNGAPFWDNNSGDGPNFNIGFCLTNSGSCQGALIDTPPGARPFWGMPYNFSSDTGGAFDPNFLFDRQPFPNPPPLTATLEARFAGGADSFGYFLVDSNGEIVPGSYVTLFTGSDAVGTTVTFSPGGKRYGFWLFNPDFSCTYVSLSSQNPCDTPGNQHFAAFRIAAASPSTYWIGCEDEPLAGSDLDYNDMIVKVTEQ